MSPATSEDKTAPNVSSPIATGGAGTAFEQHVGAMFLTLLLIRGIPAVFRNCQVKKVSFQTRYIGWETDDLLATCSTDTGGIRQLAIQVKRTFIVGRSYHDCVKTFQGFWKDFKATKRFNPNKDALLLVTSRSSNALDGLGNLLGCARSSSSVEDFACRLKTPGFLSNQAKNCQQTIRTVIAELNSSDVDEVEFWHFLKTIHILFLDFTSSTAQQEAVCKQQLAQATSSSDAVRVADSTWNKLLTISATDAPRARVFDRSDLPDDMRTLHNAIYTPRTTLQTLIEHSGVTLDAISTTISGVTLPRSKTITKAIDALIENQAVILTGPPGSGKSVLAKALIQQQASDHFCLSFRAEEFAKSHIDSVLHGSVTGKQFAILLGAQERVLIHVESFERLLEHSTRDAFTDLVNITEQYPNIRLLLTCRDYSINTTLTAFFERTQLIYDVVKVPLLDEDETAEVINTFSKLASLISHPRLKQILHIPYFLDMAARMDWPEQQSLPQDIRSFREKYWSDVIRNNTVAAAGLPDRREQALVDLAVRRARELRPSVPTDEIDVEALDQLYKDGIVLKEGQGFAAPAHDVIEDWAIIRWIESFVTKHEWQAIPISQTVSWHPAIRRGFREWLKENLDGDVENTDQFVLSAYGDSSLPPHFRDDVLISILLSHYAGDFILRQKDQMLADDARLLARLIHLARVACKKVVKQSKIPNMPLSTLLVPEGGAWQVLLKAVADELDHLLPKHIGSILGLLEDWSDVAGMNSSIPDEAVLFGRIAYPLLNQLEGYRYDGVQKRVLKVIAKVPHADDESFIDLIERASTRSEQHDSLAEEFSKLLISGLDGIPACKCFPEQMARLTQFMCCLSEHDLRSKLKSDFSLDTEPDFGLKSNIPFDFWPSSAIRGPFFYILSYHPQIGLQLVLDIVNHAGNWYGNRRGSNTQLEPAHHIIISISGDGEIKQWANDLLWQAYRGKPAIPSVIQCALMALEYWLLKKCKDSISVESWLLKILKESNNVMTTAVVASVCNAYPDLCGTAALSLIKSRKCIELDSRRMAVEQEFVSATSLSFHSTDRIYSNERKMSNAMNHRQNDLEVLALKLQSRGQAEQIYGIINDHLTEIPPEAQRTDEDRFWLLALHRMDLRCLKVGNMSSSSEDSNSENKSAKRMTIPLVFGKMDADLQNFVNTGTKERQPYIATHSLLNWGLEQWKQNSKNEDADSWQDFLTLAQDTCQMETPVDIKLVLESGRGIVAAVCVRDHLEDMADNDRQWCIDTLIAEVERNNESKSIPSAISYNPLSHDMHAAYVLPKILSYNPNDTEILKAVIDAVTHPSSQASAWAADGVAKYLRFEHGNTVLSCVGAVAMHANLLAQNEQLQTQRRMQGIFDEGHYTENALERVREAFIQNSINVEQALADLDLTSRHGWYAAERILSMLCKSMDFVLAKNFFTKTGQAIVKAWSANPKDHDTLINSQPIRSAVSKLADIVLTMTPNTALHCCKPFLNAVDKHPDKVDDFVEMLVIHEYRQLSNETCFWTVWQAFADCIVAAPWSRRVCSSRSVGTKLIDKMLFGTHWKDGLQSWHSLVDHKRQIRVLMTSLPVVSPVLMSFAHYLYNVGEISIPDDFVVVADSLRTGNPAELLMEQGTVFYLESILQRYVYGQPTVLKANPNLRTAILTILDQLVNTGSSGAYRMRDDFVTPGVDSSNSQT